MYIVVCENGFFPHLVFRPQVIKRLRTPKRRHFHYRSLEPGEFLKCRLLAYVWADEEDRLSHESYPVSFTHAL